MLISSYFKMAFSFAIISNIAISRLKFFNKVEAKIQGNGVLESKKIAQSTENVIMWKSGTAVISCWQICTNIFSNSQEMLLNLTEQLTMPLLVPLVQFV